MHRGNVGKYVLQLEMDLRHVMEPYTASNLKVKQYMYRFCHSKRAHDLYNTSCKGYVQ